ncbi:zinc finger protein 277 isoform X2 [Saccopteryx bilineata]
MIIEHKIVIANVKLIADFQRYILYWRRRFAEQPITDFCSVIRINSTAPLEEQDNYFLLCDVLPEDRVLREELQKQKLEGILEQQQREREDESFHGVCMFCSEEFLGNRSVLLNHMAREHAFNIGLPDNIVNCREFLRTLQRKLDNLQCLYCEKTFRDKNTLKDHMRKKQHRRINPKNSEYDQFYVINYLELGKSWEEVQSEDDRELLDPQEEDWSGWEEHPARAVCLFCEKQADTIEKLCVHMQDTHRFDLLKIKAELGLNFYQQVKLVNFIRRQVYQRRCYGCRGRFASRADLRAHMEEAQHAPLLPDRRTWDQPEYYFPTYENDSLLCTLSDSEGDLTGQEQNGNVTVISEDTSELHALKRSSVLNQLLRQEGLTH